MSLPIITHKFYTANNDTTSAFKLIRDAISAIQVELAATEPQTPDALALATGIDPELIICALDVMRERLEIIKDHQNQWFQAATARAALDPLATKEQAVYTYLVGDAGATLSGTAAGVAGVSQSVASMILKTLIRQQEVFMETDQTGVRRYATRETADTQLANSKLVDAFNDIASNQGTTISEAATRLYPTMNVNKAETLVRKIYRCLFWGRAIVKCP
jgi:hypothetical protein